VKVDSRTGNYVLWAVVIGFMLLVGLPPSHGAEGDKAIARVGKETITEADFNEMANAVPEKLRSMYLTPEGKKQALEYIVNVYLMAAEAQKDGLDKTPAFQKLVEFSKKELLARMFMEKASKTMAGPSEQEVKVFYDQNAPMFETPESVHVRHVLVKTEDEAKEVLKRLKKGEKFAEIAAAVSTCPSKEEGGDLGWQPKGRLSKEVEDAAFSMKKGQVTGPVKSKWGYHVLLMEDQKPASKLPFEEAKEYIVEQLSMQKQQEFFEKLAESLRQKGQVQITLPQSAPVPVPSVPAGPAPAPKK